MPSVSGIPYQAGSDTSRSAAVMQTSKVAGDRADFEEIVRSAGPSGTTCDEIVQGYGYLVQTATARLNDLHANPRYRKIAKTSLRRPTVTGALAAVYIHLDYKESAL